MLPIRMIMEMDMPDIVMIKRPRNMDILMNIWSMLVSVYQPTFGREPGGERCTYQAFASKSKTRGSIEGECQVAQYSYFYRNLELV